MNGQKNIKTHGLCTGGRLLAQTSRVHHHHHHHHCRRRRKKLLAVDLNIVPSNRVTMVKQVRQALVLTYRNKPVPELKYAYCRTDRQTDISALYTSRVSCKGHCSKQVTHDHKSYCRIH
jgi:hypothetical protein